MKHLVKIGVIFLVVVLPAGSWFYLQTGLNYRKAALEQLKPLGKLDRALVEHSGDFQSKTTLLQLADGEADIAAKLYDQFGEAETFQIVSSDVTVPKYNWRMLDAGDEMALKTLYPKANYILLDTSVTIRHIYEEPSAEIVKDLVSHVAIVLPRKKDKDIKMKSDRDGK